jgi:hypothetical protein
MVLVVHRQVVVVVADIMAAVEVLRGNVIPEVQVEDLHGLQGS